MKTKQQRTLVIIIAAIAVLLCAIIIFCSTCNPGSAVGGNSSETPEDTSSLNGGISANGVGSGEDSMDIADSGKGSSSNKNGETYSKPATVYDDYSPVAENVYEIKVTSFNAGNWWFGVNEGVPTDQPGGLDAWEYVYTHMDSDIYGLQEIYPIMYTFGDNKVLAEEYWSSKFNVKTTQGSIRWMDLPMYNGFFSKYELEDYSYGYLSDAHPIFNRLYVKSYVTIGDVRVAIFSIHAPPTPHTDNGTMPGGYTAADVAKVRLDQFNELASMLSKEDYFICMGDFNSSTPSDYDIFKKSGYNVANNSDFGEIDTSYWEGDHKPIDNIITSSNIKMNDVYREPYCGASDHWPLSAELTIVPGEAKIYNPPSVDSDGFTSDWYLK